MAAGRDELNALRGLLQASQVMKENFGLLQIETAVFSSL